LRIEASLIKRKLGILDKYSVFKNLQDRVVEKACEEIRENGIFWVEATPYKSGRKYVGFEFTVESINTHLLRIAKEEDRKKEEELREAEEQRRKELPVNEKAADEQMSLYDYTHDNLLAPNDPTPENKKVVIDGPDMDMMSAITVLRQNPGYTVDDLVKLGYSREVATTAYAINITYSL
jgi:hypothetical protein